MVLLGLWQCVSYILVGPLGRVLIVCQNQDTSRNGRSAFCSLTFTIPSSTSHYTLNSVFQHFDADRSGSIEGQELANALRQFGYNLSPQLIQLVATKYGNISLSTKEYAPLMK